MPRRTSSPIRSTLALLALAPLCAQAAIAPGGTGDGELFFVVQDPTAQVSYVLDLGSRMSEFFVWGQQDEGVQRFWEVTDPNWVSFLGQANVNGSVWAVLAADSAGPVTGSSQRLFATAQQGSEALVSTTINNLLRSGIASSGALTAYLNGVNQTGTHTPFNDYSVNGSSVNALADPGISYFGEAGGTGPRLQGNALPFSMMNAIGKSSWFYSIGSAAAAGTASVDEFDNLSNDGYWGFTFVDPNTNPGSPYAGRYLLSYTLAPALQQALATTAAGRARASLTEYLAGSPARRITAPAGEYAGYVPPSFASPGTPAALPVLLPVPEPGALLLFGAGALALLLRRRGAA